MVRAENNVDAILEALKNGAWAGTYKYTRATVIDKDGKYAWTNPIFL